MAQTNQAVNRPDQTDPSAGRCQSLAGLFLALESPLLGYALRLLRDRAQAEDIVQDAFLKLRDQFDSVRQPRSWLYRTVRNLALNHQRNARRIVPLDPLAASSSVLPGHKAGVKGDDPAGLLDATDPEPPPDEQIARWEAIGQVQVSLDSLDARSRQLVQLKFHEGLSYKDISARTGLTVGHVGYLLHGALKAIAVELAKNGVVP